jgi:hypothetical protein
MKPGVALDHNPPNHPAGTDHDEQHLQVGSRTELASRTLARTRPHRKIHLWTRAPSPEWQQGWRHDHTGGTPGPSRRPHRPRHVAYAHPIGFRHCPTLCAEKSCINHVVHIRRTSGRSSSPVAGRATPCRWRAVVARCPRRGLRPRRPLPLHAGPQADQPRRRRRITGRRDGRPVTVAGRRRRRRRRWRAQLAGRSWPIPGNVTIADRTAPSVRPSLDDPFRTVLRWHRWPARTGALSEPARPPSVTEILFRPTCLPAKEPLC